MTTKLANRMQNTPIEKLSERLWRKIDRRQPNECWPWLGTSFETGYGHVHLTRDGRRIGMSAHRALWITLYGEPHRDLDICHTCDNRICCNPSHLFAASAKTNAMDKVYKGRWNGCKGEANSFSKLTTDKVLEIRASNDSDISLARLYGVSGGNIRMIRLRKTWRHV